MGNSMWMMIVDDGQVNDRSHAKGLGVKECEVIQQRCNGKGHRLTTFKERSP